MHFNNKSCVVFPPLSITFNTKKRFFIVFAAIASCVNAYTLSGTSREAPYPSEVPISHVPFAAYGLPPQHIFSIKPSVQSEGFVAASLPASLPVSDVHSPIVLQTPGIPAESYGAREFVMNF